MNTQPMTQDLLSKAQQAAQQALEAIEQANTTELLETIRIEVLGKKAPLSAMMKDLGQLSSEDRKTFGQALNTIKGDLQNALDHKKNALQKGEINARLKTERLDVSAPVDQGGAEQGTLHPITKVTEEIIAIFSTMGFVVAEGPEIETDYYNFTALNFPEGHPAREMHDTFFIQDQEESESEPFVLRTHTSPVQIRTMEKQNPPIKVIIPGRTYRCDSDQTHTPMFHQCEGLIIDKTVHFGHLKWVLETFCREFFEVENVKMRFRPSFFPFTEPSMEVDIGCSRKGGELRIGEGDDWLEILGCGMVHPNVLKNGGINPDEYQGFAWGMGIDRLAMLKYGMPDLRAFFEGDVRWLAHYGFHPYEI